MRRSQLVSVSLKEVTEEEDSFCDLRWKHWGGNHDAEWGPQHCAGASNVWIGHSVKIPGGGADKASVAIEGVVIRELMLEDGEEFAEEAEADCIMLMLSLKLEDGTAGSQGSDVVTGGTSTHPEVLDNKQLVKESDSPWGWGHGDIGARCCNGGTKAEDTFCKYQQLP